MDQWTAQHFAYVAGILVLTGIASYTDIRFGKIPNWLTIPFFALGWMYQMWAFGWGEPGLLAGFKGFLLGFGTYFILWAIAGGGGGDVKLMGAMSVWLGFIPTLFVMILSTMMVALDLIYAMLATLFRSGIRGVRKQYFDRGKTDAEGRAVRKPSRGRILRFALVASLSAWLVLLTEATVLKKFHQFP